MPFLVLYEPEIAYNVGSIIRLSACFNSKLVIIRPFSFVWDVKKLQVAAMDYFNMVNIEFFDSFNDFSLFHTGRILLTNLKSELNYNEINYYENDAIVMGKESSGLPDDLYQKNYISLKIPIQARSLNLSLSSAILLSYACQDFF